MLRLDRDRYRVVHDQTIILLEVIIRQTPSEYPPPSSRTHASASLEEYRYQVYQMPYIPAGKVVRYACLPRGAAMLCAVAVAPACTWSVVRDGLAWGCGAS